MLWCNIYQKYKTFKNVTRIKEKVKETINTLQLYSMPFVEHTHIVEYNFQNGEYTCYILFLLVNGYISSGKQTVLGHASIGNKVISKNYHLNTFFYPNLLLKKIPRYFLSTLIKPLC